MEIALKQQRKEKRISPQTPQQAATLQMMGNVAQSLVPGAPPSRKIVPAPPSLPPPITPPSVLLPPIPPPPSLPTSNQIPGVPLFQLPSARSLIPDGCQIKDPAPLSKPCVSPAPPPHFSKARPCNESLALPTNQKREAKVDG